MRSAARPQSGSYSYSPDDHEERAPEATQLGFVGAVMANGVLAGVQGVIAEILHGVSEIPRFHVADPFSPGNFGFFKDRPVRPPRPQLPPQEPDE